MSGSAGRAAAGAVSVGSALGAALTNRRTLGQAEAGLLTVVAMFTVCVAVLAAWFPRLLAWPVAVVCGWLGVAWSWKAWTLWRKPPPGLRAPDRGERPSKAAATGEAAKPAIIDDLRP